MGHRRTTRLETLTRAPRLLLAAGSDLTDDVIRPGALFMGLMRTLEADGLCAARIAQNLTVNDLARVCEAFRPDVVHLVAHGGTAGGRGVLLMAANKPEGLRNSFVTFANSCINAGAPLVLVIPPLPDALASALIAAILGCIVLTDRPLSRLDLFRLLRQLKTMVWEYDGQTAAVLDVLLFVNAP